MRTTEAPHLSDATRCPDASTARPLTHRSASPSLMGPPEKGVRSRGGEIHSQHQSLDRFDDESDRLLLDGQPGDGLEPLPRPLPGSPPAGRLARSALVGRGQGTAEAEGKGAPGGPPGR
jgi:hypothetical protein